MRYGTRLCLVRARFCKRSTDSVQSQEAAVTERYIRKWNVSARHGEAYRYYRHEACFLEEKNRFFCKGPVCRVIYDCFLCTWTVNALVGALRQSFSQDQWTVKNLIFIFNGLSSGRNRTTGGKANGVAGEVADSMAGSRTGQQTRSGRLCCQRLRQFRQHLYLFFFCHRVTMSW